MVLNKEIEFLFGIRSKKKTLLFDSYGCCTLNMHFHLYQITQHIRHLLCFTYFSLQTFRLTKLRIPNKITFISSQPCQQNSILKLISLQLLIGVPQILIVFVKINVQAILSNAVHWKMKQYSSVSELKNIEKSLCNIRHKKYKSLLIQWKNIFLTVQKVTELYLLLKLFVIF